MNKDWLDIDVLEDYLDGKLDGKAMHFVEKQALEDPFIAEALEGLRQSPKRKQNFSILQKKLYERIAQKPVKRKLWGITTQRLSIAATATVVFISVSILFFMRENNRKNAEIAQRKAEGVVVNIGSNADLASTKPETKTPLPVGVAEKSAVIEKAIADAKNKDLAINSKKISTGKAISNLPKPVPFTEEISAKQEKSSAPVERAKQAVVSQADVYSSNALDSDKKSLGYAKDKALSEEASAKASAEKRKDIESASKVLAANKPRPAVVDYNKYLATNNKLLNKTSTPGMVTLNFKINKNGRPENIKVVKSLNKEADAEAIRLVKEGPNWLLPTEGADLVDLEVKF